MKRILAVGHGQDGSGFARVLRGILSGLCHDFDIHHIGLNGFGAGAPGDWIRHPCRDPNDAYGFDELRLQMGALRPDVVFVLHDLWILPGYLDAMQGFKAPVVAYTHKDTLQSSFLLSKLGLPDGAYPCHYVPGAASHFNAIRYGLGYGMVPELLLKASAEPGEMVVLTRGKPVEVALYWHTWKVQSPRMEHLSQQIISSARKILK